MKTLASYNILRYSFNCERHIATLPLSHHAIKKKEKISFCRIKFFFNNSSQVSYLPTRTEKWQGKIKENYNFTHFVFSYTLEFGRSCEDNFSKEAIP